MMDTVSNNQTSLSFDHSLGDAKTTQVEKLAQKIDTAIRPLGYETVEIEIITGRQSILRLFIDWSFGQDQSGIGIEDCVKVSHAIDPLLDTWEELNGLFGDHSYELEVSSPGLERPLRKKPHLESAVGKLVKLQLVRPLLEDEAENSRYWSKNTKQKVFMGQLKEVIGNPTPTSEFNAVERLVIGLRFQAQDETVSVPFHLISKAHLIVEDAFGKNTQSKKGRSKK